MLTHISIENFKGIRDRVEIELKPITLLFGPNSAGKSTILHALLYAQEVFERHNLDADATAAGGPFNDLGGFRNFVHHHNLDLPVRLGFEFKLDDHDFSSVYKHDADAFECLLDCKAERIIDNPKSAGVCVTVRWSGRLERPVVESCRLQLDSLDFVEITSDSTSHERRLRLLAIDHPLFRRPEAEQHDVYDLAGEEPAGYDEADIMGAASIFHLAIDEVGTLFRGTDEEGFSLPWRDEDDALPRPDASVPLVDALDAGRARDEVGRRAGGELTRRAGGGIRGRAGGGIRGFGMQHAISLQRIAFDIAAFLDSIVTSILRGLRRRLREFRYLGPVREIPSRSATRPKTPDPSRWSTGLGAWDELQSCDEQLVREVNHWLANPARFNAGVTLGREPLYGAPQSRQAKMKAPRKGEVRRATSPGETRLCLYAADDNLRLSLYDVGVGIAQLLPVILAALDKSTAFFAIEQPELHLHPAAQVVVGDLLMAGAETRPRLFLVETHSEHLLLRLLRRVRETAQGTLPEGGKALKPEQIAVVYVQSVDGHVRVTRLQVTEDGDFAGSWPEGFFDERAKELF